MNQSITTPKEWGVEHTVLNGDHYCHKRLIYAPGKMSSIHKHNKKHETFVVKQGFGLLQIDIAETDAQQMFYLKPNACIEIPPDTYHRVINCGGEMLEIHEYSTHHDDEDVVRLSVSGDIPAPAKTAIL